MLQLVNQRLNQILQPHSRDIAFANISVIAFGDFYQLAPVQGSSLLSYDPGALADNLWALFAKHELQEVMRQKDDKAFAHMLNRIRTM